MRWSVSPPVPVMSNAAELLILSIGTENAYLRAWFDSDGAETKPIG